MHDTFNDLRCKAITLIIAFIVASIPATMVWAKLEDTPLFYEDALERFNQADYDGAIIQLKNVLQKERNNLSARILLGKAYLRSENFTLAEQELSSALANGADANLVMVDLANSWLQLNRFEQLTEPKNFNFAELSNSVHSELLVIIGISQAKQLSPDQAKLSFEKAHRLAPSNPSPLLALAAMEFNSRQLDAASSTLSRVAAITLESPEMWELKARISELMGDYQQALLEYDKTLTIDPARTTAQVYKAQALMTLGRTEEALALLKPLYNAEVFKPNVSFAYATALATTGKMADAKLVLANAHTELTSIDNEIKLANPTMLLLSATIAFQNRDFQIAIEQSRLALERYPELKRLRLILAESFLQTRQPEEALATLEPLARKPKASLATLALYGHTLLLNGQYTQADTVLEHVAKAAPDYSPVLIDLGLAQLAGGKNKSAEQHLRRAIKSESGAGRSGFILGFSQLERQLYSEAEATANELLEKSPENPIALNLRARAELAQDKLDAAKASLERALIKDPAYVPAILTLAKLDVMHDNTAQAHQRLATALEGSSQNIRLIAGQANIERLLGNNEAAIKLLEKAYSLDSQQVFLALRLVDLYLASEQYNTAIEFTQQLGEQHPTDLLIQFTQAKAYLAAGKPGFARSTLRKALHFQGMNGPKLLELARWQMRAGDISGAILALNDAYTSFPDYLPAQMELVKLESSLGNYSRAHDIIRTIKQQQPETPTVAMLEADVYSVAGEYGKAENILRQIINNNPTPMAVVRLAQLKFTNGHRKEAIAILEKWRNTAYANDIQLANHLALQYLLVGQAAKSKKIYLALISRFPNEATFHNNLALAQLALGESDAVESARTAYSLAPQDASILDTYGWVLTENNRASEGLEYLRESYARDSDSPSIRFHLAKALSDLHNYDEAKQLLNSLLIEDGSSESHLQAANLMTELTRKN